MIEAHRTPLIVKYDRPSEGALYLNFKLTRVFESVNRGFGQKAFAFSKFVSDAAAQVLQDQSKSRCGEQFQTARAYINSQRP
jgi:hypothetical protein